MSGGERERRKSPHEVIWDNRKKIVAGVAVAVGKTLRFICIYYFIFNIAAGWAISRYNVALPHQMVAFTGPGISGVKVQKQGVRWPFQTCSYFDLTPKKMDLHIDATSADMQDVGLPMSFTVGPDPEKLVEYVTFLGGAEDPDAIIHNIIEPEARAVAARLGIQKIFGDRDAYR